jgi:hypothetical protein
MVRKATAALWSEQDRHPGDRKRLFSAVSNAIEAERVLYPGSFVDISPSFVFDSAVYVDSDKRAKKFFADEEGVLQIIAEHEEAPDEPDITFLHADYTSKLDLPDQDVDLLISLFAGFVSDHCTEHLRIGGTLLVNGSHGDAGLASIDPRYDLEAVVIARAGEYRVSTANLDTYLVPKKSQEVTRERILTSGRGLAYRVPAFAYLFTRTD